ncbi:hypothetical protein CERSUDRAFT_95100 [Gelatoporia subvermispora B]|uniref:Uncharacterized protein n=1 Tax=Ceriporiopsis subvermispora (strain B) TaxID=914234 RepID=M2QXH7_CERS8|nr:hypothetical protein CERSUDRAFT_95100 [Gelatoporia subvermispora B]
MSQTARAQTQGHRKSHANDTVLVLALLAGRRLKQANSEMIEELDGVNGYSAAEWKDYCLDHMVRLMQLVDEREASRKTRRAAIPNAQPTPRCSVAPLQETGNSPAREPWDAANVSRTYKYKETTRRVTLTAKESRSF